MTKNKSLTTRYKLNQEMIELIYDLKMNCISVTKIAEQFGVSRATIYDWINPDNDRYSPEFAQQYYRGERDAKKVIKEKAMNAILSALEGSETVATILDDKGKVTAQKIKKSPPNLQVAMKVMMALNYSNRGFKTHDREELEKAGELILEKQREVQRQEWIPFAQEDQKKFPDKYKLEMGGYDPEDLTWG